VLPGGCDAEDIADQAIGEMLAGHCRLAVGFIRERVVKELKRLVSQRVRVLHGLREAAAMRGEWDAAPSEEGAEPVSVFDGILDQGADGYEAAAERGEALERRKREFEKYLDGEQNLRPVFGCLCAGVTKPGEIARRLGMEERAVRNARKRLERRLAEFVRGSGGRKRET